MLVELLVVRVNKLDTLQAFVLGDETVADNLDFRLVGYGFQVWVEDAPFGVEGFAVAVTGRAGIEALGQLVLGFG